MLTALAYLVALASGALMVVGLLTVACEWLAAPVE
jgi:hypothetical protein